MTERFHRKLVTTWLGVALLLPAAVSSAANREHQQLMADIRMLQEQTQQLQITLNALTEALKQVTTRIDEQGNATRKALADQKLLIDTLSGDVRVVREKVDETNVRVSSLAQELEAVRVTVSQPPAPVVPPVTDDTLPDSPDAPEPTLGQPAPPSVAGLSPQRLYDTAYADYAAGQWSLAIQGFETYIKAFPRTEQADDAQIYIGEAYSFDGRDEQAAAAYGKVITNYPTGDMVAMAYYKSGLALLRLNQADRAREAWQAVVDKFPDSDAGRLARQGLDRRARPIR